MKKQLTIFGGIIFTFALMYAAYSNADSTKANATSTKINFNDTTFIKSIHWDSLNTFVDFHILQRGNETTDTNSCFIIRPIAIYSYLENQFEVNDDSVTQNINSRELKELILSDTFANWTNFDCLLRINTQIGYYYRPDLLRTIIVRAKDMSDKNIKWLMNDLKKEIFTESVTSKIQKGTFLGEAAETIFINIKLKPDFGNLKKIKEICDQLSKRPDVSQAFFTDLFTGLNEGEVIFRLTTDEKSSH